MIVVSNFCKSADIKLLIVFEFSVINRSCVVLSDMIEANVLLYAVFVLNKLVSFVYIMLIHLLKLLILCFRVLLLVKNLNLYY